MESLWKDITFGLRMLIRKPAFTVIAVLTLALGIGANTAIFTLFDAVLLESLPVREPSRLVLFSEEVGEGTSTGSLPNGTWKLFTSESYEFLKKQPLPFESLCAFRSGEDPVTSRFSGETDSVRSSALTCIWSPGIISTCWAWKLRWAAPCVRTTINSAQIRWRL